MYFDTKYADYYFLAQQMSIAPQKWWQNVSTNFYKAVANLCSIRQPELGYNYSFVIMKIDLPPAWKSKFYERGLVIMLAWQKCDKYILLCS